MDVYLAYFDLSVTEYASFCWLGNVSGQGAFSVKFAKSIDDKIDDGRGDRGKVRASNVTRIVDFSNSNDGCLNNDGTYNLNRADQKNCKLRSDLY